MKTVKLMSLSILLVGMAACAQKNDTPKAVTNAFAKKFPTAKSVSWDKEGASEWEAEFKMDGMEYSANFDTKGTWKETEHAVELSKVPQKVKDALMKNFPDYKVKESEVSETADGMVYEFEIKKGDSKMEIAIDANGIIKKKEKMGDEENDKEDND